MEGITPRPRLIALGAGLALISAALWPAVAFGHANLLRTEPAIGSVVKTAPQVVLLHFDQEVRPVAGGTQVIDSRGNNVMAGPARTAPSDVRTLVIPLQPGLPDGDYTVRWNIVSTDGHIEIGVFPFGVGTGRPPPQAASFSGSSEDWNYLAARAAYFAGLLLLIGGVVFRLAVFAPALARAPEGSRKLMALRERHRANQVLAVSAALALAGGWIALTIQGADVAGVSFWEAFDHRGPVASAIQSTRFGREFGHGIDVTAGFTVLVALAYAAAPYGRRISIGLLGIPALALGIWALAVPGISGHAGDPGRGWWVVAVDALHVAAAAVWAGGLVQLAWVAPHATRGMPDGERERSRSVIAHRFSTIALGCVIVVALTGGIRALKEVGAVSEIWSTSYGQTLIVKTVLLAILIVLGYRNRHMLDRFTSLRRSVTVEIGLMAGLVCAVALLTNLPPANTPSSVIAAGAPQAPSGGPARVALPGGAKLAYWPGTAGTNVLALQAPGRARPTAVLQLPGGGTRSVTFDRAAGGSYTAFVDHLPAGQVSATISAGAKTYAARLTIGARGPGAGPAPPPAARGTVAAGEAADMAVGLQRVGKRTARVFLIGAGGGVPRTALALVDGHPAVPCAATVTVCFTAPVPSAASTVRVVVERPGHDPVHTAIALAAANAPSASAIVTRSGAALRALRSLEIDNVLASDPDHSVRSTFIVNRPDRLGLTASSGAQSRIIGAERWDRTSPTGVWTKQPTTPVKVPDPYWVAGGKAAYVVGGTPSTVDVTLAQNGASPVFYRLTIERSTGRVLHLEMITAAHFMNERYLRFDQAPRVTPPPA